MPANKKIAIAMIASTLPMIILAKDATATVFMSFIAVPLFLAEDVR